MKIHKSLLLLLTISICMLPGCGASQGAQAPETAAEEPAVAEEQGQEGREQGLAAEEQGQETEEQDQAAEEQTGSAAEQGAGATDQGASTTDQATEVADQAADAEAQAAEAENSSSEGLDFSQTPAPDMSGIEVKQGDVKTFDGHSYYFLMVSGRKPDLMEAEAICRELGGHLGTITSREEQEFVGTFYAESPWHEAVGTWWAMTGAYRENASAPWKWVTGEEFTYTDDLPAEDPEYSGDTEALEWIGIKGFSKYSGGDYYEGPFGNWYIVGRDPGSAYDSQLLLVEWDE